MLIKHFLKNEAFMQDSIEVSKLPMNALVETEALACL